MIDRIQKHFSLIDNKRISLLRMMSPFGAIGESMLPHSFETYMCTCQIHILSLQNFALEHCTESATSLARPMPTMSSVLPVCCARVGWRRTAGGRSPSRAGALRLRASEKPLPAFFLSHGGSSCTTEGGSSRSSKGMGAFRLAPRFLGLAASTREASRQSTRGEAEEKCLSEWHCTSPNHHAIKDS